MPYWWDNVFDGTGRLVPEREQKPFIYRKRAADLCRRVEQAVSHLAMSLERSPYGQQADPDKVQIELIKALTEVQRNIPFMLCPAHKPCCPICGGKRWLSEVEAERVHLSTLQES